MAMNLEDEAHFMDELFGDTSHVPIQPPVVIIKGLSQTLDHLACSNACQKIAWSKTGNIAAISPDARSVRLYVLIRGSKSGSWNLSKPITLPFEVEEDHQLVHVSWNQMGGMLSVFDSCGRINIFDTVNNTSGHMSQVRKGNNDPESEMDAIAASYWLPVLPYAEKRPFAQSASLQNGSWNPTITGRSLTPIGAHNILSTQSAILILTKRGNLRILFQQSNGQFDEDKTTIDPPIFPMDNYITHGAFAPHTETSVLLATYDNSKCLRVFQINVTFNPAPASKSSTSAEIKDKQKVSFEIKSLAFCSNISPSPAEPYGNDGATAAGVPGEQYALTHLEMLPMVHQDARATSSPTVFAVFSLIGPQYHGTSSIVCRWHLREGPESVLLPVWDELPLKRKASDVAPRKDTRLERLPDMPLPSIVLSISIVRQCTMLAFTMSDGSVQFRFRESLDLASADGSYEEVQSLPQAGFAFPIHEPALFVALSPSACCAGTMNADGDVKLRKMVYSVGDVVQIKEDDAHFGAFAAIFALHWVTAWFNYTTVDDLMAIFPTYMNEGLAAAAILQSCNAIGPLAAFDYVEPNQASLQKLYQSGLLEKVLGAFFVLYTQKDGRMTQSAKLSWVALNMRMLTTNLNFYNQTTQSGKSPEDVKPDFTFILGAIRWSQDLITYVIQELLDMAYELGDKISDKEAVLAFVRKNNSAGLLLSLCSLTRLVLRNGIRSLKKAYDIGIMVIKNKMKDPQTVLWMHYFKAFRSSPLLPVLYKDDQIETKPQLNKPPMPKPLEALFLEIENAVKKCYADAKIDEKRRAVMERDMFLRADIPDILMPAVTLMLRRVSDIKDTPGISALSIWYHDVSWLGITEENIGKHDGNKSSTPKIDVIRKMGVGSGKSFRRCPRCKSIAEDFADGQTSGFPGWLTKSTRTCVCSDQWAVQEEEDSAINSI